MADMPSTRVAEWQKIPVNLAELCLGTTLRCGQSFRWKKSGKDEWSCALHGRILSLRQDPQYLHYRAVYPPVPALRAGRSVKTEKPGKRDRSRRGLHAGAEGQRQSLRTGLLPTPPSSSPPSDRESRDLKPKVIVKNEADAIGDEKSLQSYSADNGTHFSNDDDDDDNNDDDTTDLVKHYLNLDPNLEALYEQWAAADENFKRRAPRFTGVRILRQDSWEALVGFICSSNNNIARISQMVDKLCTHYGALVGYLGHTHGDRASARDSSSGGGESDGEDVKGPSASAIPYFDFPSPGVLARPGVEQHLRELGFGYRAKYLHQTAIMVTEKGLGWLDGLRNPESPAFRTRYGKGGVSKGVGKSGGEMMDDGGGREGYRYAHQSLLALQGVGPKVADCVCLMGLGWGEAVPVDTHVWQIAQRDYRFGKGRHSSLTKATYDAIGARFRSLWGNEAGWAHSVLFAADLRTFADRLVVAKVEQDSSSSDDGLPTKVKVEVKAEGEEIDRVEGLATRMAVVKEEEWTGVTRTVKRESEEQDQDVGVKAEEKEEEEKKEVSSARSLRAKRRRMV